MQCEHFGRGIYSLQTMFSPHPLLILLALPSLLALSLATAVHKNERLTTIQHFNNNIAQTKITRIKTKTKTASFVEEEAEVNNFRFKASPEEDLEAEISKLNVKLVASPSTCGIVGTQHMEYTFMNGEFETLRTDIGDDTIGIGFYTKDILDFNSTEYHSCSSSATLEENTSALTCLQTMRRATTKCRSELEWQFPPFIATDAKPRKQHYRIKFAADMGVIQNQTHLYNEMVYSTGFHHRLAIKHIQIDFQLPHKYKRHEIVIMGNSRDTSYGSTYNEKTGVVSFVRKTYLAPMNRYTARVWFPTQKTTKSCAPCSRVDDWLMMALLIPFFLCFIIPCCLHLYGKDNVKRSGPMTRDGDDSAPRFEGAGQALGGSGNDGDSRGEHAFCGCCCERPRDEEGRPITRDGDPMAREPLIGGSGNNGTSSI